MPIYEPVVILRPDKVSIHPTARIDAFVKIEGGEGVAIHEAVHVASFCHINAGGGQVILGAHSGYASGVVICGGQPDLSYRHVSPQDPSELRAAQRRLTIISPFAVVFANAVVLPGVLVGEGAIVGAGAVVTRDIPPWEVWAGNPARKVGERRAAR